MSLKNLRFSSKITVCFSLIVAMVTVMCVVVFGAIGSTESASYASDRASAVLTAANSALASAVEQQNAVRGFVATGSDEFAKGFETKGKGFEARALLAAVRTALARSLA